MESEKFFAFASHDYRTMMRLIGEIVHKKCSYSVDQIAEMAGIFNEYGEPSRNKIYKFWEGIQEPRAAELQRLIKFFHKNHLPECVQILHSYFFGKIGMLMEYDWNYHPDGDFDENLHCMSVQLGKLNEDFLKSIRDHKIDFREAERLKIHLRRLMEHIQNALHELENYSDQ